MRLKWLKWIYQAIRLIFIKFDKSMGNICTNNFEK